MIRNKKSGFSLLDIAERFIGGRPHNALNGAAVDFVQGKWEEIFGIKEMVEDVHLFPPQHFLERTQRGIFKFF